MENIIEYLKEAVSRELQGCQLRSADGLSLFTPDGMGNYPALWTRDFAYMVEYAGELMDPEQMRCCLCCTLDHARQSDGWIPDRVDTTGAAIYSAGNPELPCGEPNLDDGPFAVMIAYFLLKYLDQATGKQFMEQYAAALYRGLTCIPRGEGGLVDNPTEKSHSPYGFTDCICKTGLLMKESLLYWRGCRMLSELLTRYQMKPDWAEELSRQADSIENSLEKTFGEPNGMLLAATKDCRQIDVWGSCYALAIGFPLTESRKASIVDWLLKNRDEILQDGQLRHTAPGEFWEKCLLPVPEGEYQNGAYWATATGWYAQAVWNTSPETGKKVLEDVVRYFQEYGIYECVNGDYRKLPHYVVSATNVYGAAKKLL